MNPALFNLVVLSIKSGVRRAFRGAKTFKGALAICFSGAVLFLMVGPSIFAAAALRGQPGISQLSGWLEPYLPIFILCSCLLGLLGPAGDAAISFTPAEVDLLFPAPFKRRELLVYKIFKLLLGSVFLALIFSMTFALYLNMWIAAFVGIFLTMTLGQLIALAVALAGQIVAEYAYTSGRKLILLGAGALVAAGLVQVVWQTPTISMTELALGFQSSWPGRVVLAPFKVFSQTILAHNVFPELVSWGAGAAAIDLALLALILKLDADYLEGAAAISQKIYTQRLRARQGGGVALPTSKNAARLRVPTLPWLWGAGPLAWRQLLLAMRTSRLAIFASVGTAGVMLAMAVLMPAESQKSGWLIPSIGLWLISYLTFIFTMQLPWAFRGDIDHIDSLKTLPITSLAMAGGQLAGGVLVLAAIQSIVVLAILAGGGRPAIVITASAFLVPFDVLMLGVSNALFLLYPVRMTHTNSADFQLMGRVMLLMLLQFLVLIPGLAIPAGIGGIVFWMSGWSWLSFASAAWVVLLAELPPMLFVLAWVFDRFDPSSDLPA